MQDSSNRRHVGERRAEIILLEAVKTSFGERYNEGTGAEIYRCMWGDMRRESMSPIDSHTDDCFQNFLLKVVRWLERHRQTVILEPRAWLHQVRRRTTIDYLSRHGKRREYSESDMGDVLHGRIALPQTRYHDSHEVKEKVVQAVMLLDNPRHREFIYFDLILLLPKEEIISRLGIAPGYFAKLKHKAMKDLRAAIIKVMTR